MAEFNFLLLAGTMNLSKHLKETSQDSLIFSLEITIALDFMFSRPYISASAGTERRHGVRVTPESPEPPPPLLSVRVRQPVVAPLSSHQ